MRYAKEDNDEEEAFAFEAPVLVQPNIRVNDTESLDATKRL